MVCGDVNYCTEKNEVYTDKQICRVNKCKSFIFNPIDALGINENGYQPRNNKKLANKNQLTFEV